MKKGETRLELRPMANEYPVLKTSASGHVECRTSRLGGWGRRMALKCACVCKGGIAGASLGCSLREIKTSGDTQTIWSWRIIDFHPRWIDAQRRHKPGETYVQACALSQSRTRSAWREQASHNVLLLMYFFRNSGNMVCWLLLARLVMLVSVVNTENTSDIYKDGGLLTTTKHRLLSRCKQKFALHDQMTYNFNSILYCLYWVWSSAYLEGMFFATSPCKSFSEKLTHSYANVMG